MIDPLRLMGLPSIARFDLAESVVAVTPDDSRDGKTTALAKIADLQIHLSASQAVIDAIDKRISLFPVPPPPVTLQDLVRSGRRRLSDERQRGARTWVSVRTQAATRLQSVLEA
jgi:hypothetical protein